VLLTSFEVEYRLDDDDDEVVGRMQTVFGFFPTAAFADQPGLPATPEEMAWLDRPSTFSADLRARGGAAGPRLAGGRLLVLDRVTGYWPEAGAAGRGRLRAETDIDPSAWFFKAHFFQDPVQPGSLGLEAMVQLLQFYVIERGLARDMRAPRFLPLDLGRTLRWKYRGQVVPPNRRVVVEVEVTSAGRDDAGAYAVAEAWLWVDGKRIYSASNLGVRVMEGAADDPSGASARTSPLDTTGARAYWRRRVGAGPGLAEDLVDGLARQFVERVAVADPGALEAVHGRPALFLANHQTGIESLLFSVLVSGLHGRVLVALAKAEHRQSWLGQLAQVLAQAPGTALPANLVFFDRSDGASLLAIVDRLRRRMADEDASLLVHVEGTRALSAGHALTRMSGVWTDLALAAGAAVVPVRFTGGLPATEASQRLEFPVGFGRQTYHLGRPLLPEDLRPLDLAARQRRVLDAINGLAPAADVPAAADPDFASALEGWRRRVGDGGERAVLLAALARLPSPSAETRAVLEAVAGGRALGEKGDARQRWIGDVGRWLAGAHPPERA
jgi:3-hydroxymyristoyl/3-hydroxydecanoyl-(acyl carrier protein) dehydratase/1-acyl-sn-glycerol-3-phosphate acyltransferase